MKRSKLVTVLIFVIYLISLVVFFKNVPYVIDKLHPSADISTIEQLKLFGIGYLCNVWFIILFNLIIHRVHMSDKALSVNETLILSIMVYGAPIASIMVIVTYIGIKYNVDNGLKNIGNTLGKAINSLNHTELFKGK